ncbi:MAG: electron transfer flavoprotein subunit beta/FixA family protein [Acidobacteria bacterium]|nr:electron transfer flavoprotein subunit beta/FixA family protein [Acidobacteriota bacterium]
MKIGVCLKQVPAKDAPLRINEAQTWVREGDISYETCEPDNFALEAALQLKEKHGGEVVVVSLGPERVRQVIKEGLAKGAERALHVQDDQFHTLDPLLMAAGLAGAVREEKFDLILTGLQSDDHGYGQTGVILAELLGLPHATIIMEIQVQEGRLRVKRELEAGWFQWVELPLPAVLTIQSGINKPRYASLKGIMAAKKKEIRTLSRADVLPAEVVASQETKKIYVPQKTKKTEFIEGPPKEAATKLLEKLKHEARVL